MGTGNPSFIGHRQQHNKCIATTSLQFDPLSEDEKAGLIIFQGEHNFYYLCMSVSGGKHVVQLYRTTKDNGMELLTQNELRPGTSNLFLRIEASGATYKASYRANNKNWILLKEDIDGKFLSTKTAGGFVGSLFGMYATSSGKESNTKAYFDWFEYVGNDDIYKE